MEITCWAFVAGRCLTMEERRLPCSKGLPNCYLGFMLDWLISTKPTYSQRVPSKNRRAQTHRAFPSDSALPSPEEALSQRCREQAEHMDCQAGTRQRAAASSHGAPKVMAGWLFPVRACCHPQKWHGGSQQLAGNCVST